VVVPYDEVNINPDDLIIRRINPNHHVVFDDNRNCLRISSKAYSPSNGPDAGMSIDIEKLIIAGGHSPQQYVVNPVFTGAVVFSASAIRSLGLWIGYEPVHANPYHGEVWGSVASRHNKFTKTQKDGLAGAAAWYVQIDGVALQ
jgi:hypothetical protein